MRWVLVGATVLVPRWFGAACFGRYQNTKIDVLQILQAEIRNEQLIGNSEANCNRAMRLTFSDKSNAILYGLLASRRHPREFKLPPAGAKRAPAGPTKFVDGISSCLHHRKGKAPHFHFGIYFGDLAQKAHISMTDHERT